MLPRRSLRAAFAVFAVAGLIGALFRFVAAYGWSTGLDAVNVRHAHSHLMYFGWVTPALFAWIALTVKSRVAPPVRTLGWTLALAVVTSVAFAAWGYGAAGIGSARIPVTIILSTACMVVWYVWLAWYRTARAALADHRVRRLWDLAAVFLGVSTLGAWSVAAFVPFGGAAPAVKAAFAHLFLQYFSEGWFVLGVLGVAWASLDPRVRVPSWALALLVAGVSGGFLLSLPSAMLPDNLRLVAQLAGLAHGAGTLGIAWTWWKHARAEDRDRWGAPMLILAAKGATQAVAVLVPGIWWADRLPVRVLYLHVLLLGVVTLTLAATVLDRRWLRVFQVAVFTTVAVLVPMTELWPGGPGGLWTLEWAAWGALPAPLVALAAVLVTKRSEFPVLLHSDRPSGPAANQETHESSESDPGPF